jgi:cobalt-precorrin 5A hydrolase
MIVAGVGCRRDCPAGDVVALVRRAMASAGCAVSALAAPEFRRDEPGVRRAAASLGLPLTLVDRDALAAAQSRCVTHSIHAEHAFGLASIAEAAALCAAGPESVLVLPRIAGARATCALARSGAP